jgi:hypothetical protein
MAQHADYIIANQSGAGFRADLNNALAAIVSNNSGATAPATTYAYMPWADTTAGLFKIRNGANSAWITLYQLDGEWSTIALENGTAAAPSLYFKDSGTDTGLFSAGTDQVNIATAGVERVEWGTSEVVFNDSGENYDFRVEGDTRPNLLLVDASADSVGVDGTLKVTNGVAELADGTAAAPSLTFGSDTNTGIYRVGADTLGIAAGGVKVGEFGSNGITGVVRTATAVTASGTAVDFTSIPSWVKRVTVMLSAVSLSGTALVRFRLGDSTIATSGYSGVGSYVAAAGAASVAQTAGFDIYTSGTPSSSAAYSGSITFVNVSGNTWVASGVFAAAAGNLGTFPVAGTITLTTALTQVRITTSNGTDTFDAGTINILYEG